MSTLERSPDSVEFPSPLAEDDPVDVEDATNGGTLAVTEGGVAEILETYTSPLYDKSWRMKQPQKWEDRRTALVNRVSELFTKIDGPAHGGEMDGKLTRAELEDKLMCDDELENYMVLCGRDTKNIFNEIDGNHDGLVSREEFHEILTARGHSYSIAWLEEQVVWHERAAREKGMNDDVERDEHTGELVSCRDLGHPHPSLCLLLSVQEDDEGQPTRFVTNETAELCNRLWAAGLSVDMRMSVDKCEVMVLIGISNMILREEAQEMSSLRMRLTKTKGMIEYEPDYHEYYTRQKRHLLGMSGDMFVFDEKGKVTDEFAGEEYTTVWTSALKQQVIKHRMKSKGLDVETRMRLASLDHQLATCRKRVDKGLMMRAQRLKELLTGAGAFRLHCDEIMGNHIDLLARQCLADSTFTMYPDSEMYEGEPVRQENGVVDDSQSKLKPGGTARMARMQMKACDEHLIAAGLPTLQYDDIRQVIDELETYHAPGGAGHGELFVGSLQMVLPLHDEEELSLLRKHWGSWGLMFKMVYKVKPNEGEFTLAKGDPALLEVSTKYWELIPTGFLHQPIDEIRDYFGDGTGMYFSWLEVYTKALAMASIFGIPTMFNQWLSEGGVNENNLTIWYSVWLSIWSVVFLSVWKRREAELAFLWGSEGFEASEQPRTQFKGVIKVNEETKREELVYGSTAIRYLVKIVSMLVIVLCMLITAGCAFGAMGLKFRAPRICNEALLETKADLGCADWTIIPKEVGHIGPDGDPEDENSTKVWLVKTTAEYNAECCYDHRLREEAIIWDNLSFWQSQKWVVTSSLINLAVIIVAGLVYEGVAAWLNELENYRTATEFADQLIVKNFAFQFINNYFLLFYIAYLRQIEFAGSSKQCDKSCLGELQMQMLVVFTGKTFGLQLVELSKPFVVRKLMVVMKFLQLKELITSAVDATTSIVQAPINMVSGLVDMIVDGSQPDEQEEGEKQRKAEEDAMEAARAQRLLAREEALEDMDKDAMGVYEYQTHMINYEVKGTFDDFNEMAIQYGYVALFSPCFPLAPFFAFVNNVTEIRGDAWKLCRAFQRPSARPQEDIGSWYGVLNTIGFIAVLTNATMIAFVGSQMATTDWVVPQDRDEETERTLGASDSEYGAEMSLEQTKIYLRSMGHPDIIDSLWSDADANGDDKLQPSEFPQLLDSIERTAVSSITIRKEIAPLWIYALIIEHMVFLTRIVILTKFPTTPAWISGAKEVVTFRLAQMKKETQRREGVRDGIFTDVEEAGPQKGSLHVTVIEAEGLPKMDLISANDNYVLITIQDDVDGMKSSKQTSTLEGSGAAPKWKAGEGETLIFHGLHLGKIDLLAKCFDDDVGPTDDLIGSVKFPIADTGLTEDGEPVECWKMLGQGSDHNHHHSLFGHKHHGDDQDHPPTAAGRLRLRLTWQKRSVRGLTLATDDDDADELTNEGESAEFVMKTARQEAAAPAAKQGQYDGRGLKAQFQAT